MEVAPHVDAFPQRVRDRQQVIAHECRPAGAGGIRQAVLGDVDWQPRARRGGAQEREQSLRVNLPAHIGQRPRPWRAPHHARLARIEVDQIARVVVHAQPIERATKPGHLLVDSQRPGQRQPDPPGCDGIGERPVERALRRARGNPVEQRGGRAGHEGDQENVPSDAGQRCARQQADDDARQGQHHRVGQDSRAPGHEA